MHHHLLFVVGRNLVVVMLLVEYHCIFDYSCIAHHNELFDKIADKKDFSAVLIFL